jgi:hypothetical protein
MRTFRRGKIARRVIKRNKWPQESHYARHTNHVDLDRRLKVGFLLGILSLAHHMTNRAWVTTVERLDDSGAQRLVLRILDDHGCPRDRLQRHPVQTDGATKRNDHTNAANAANHAARLVIASIKVNQSRDASCLHFRVSNWEPTEKKITLRGVLRFNSFIATRISAR